MEMEDPIHAKFLSLIESLMAKTTSEIVKVFADVLIEMKVEISHSCREINALKMEECEEPNAEAVYRSEAAVTFKREPEEVLASDDVVKTPTNPKNDDIDMTHSLVVHEPETLQTTPPDTTGINQPVNSPKQTEEVQLTQTILECKINCPVKTTRDTELQKSANEVLSNSPLQAISIVSPQQPSCSSSLDSDSSNREDLAFKTDIFCAEEIQEEETVSFNAVDEKGIPGFHHVARLAEYLVELRNVTTLALTNQQASTIIDLWQNLDTWDKQQIVFVAHHNHSRLLTESEDTFTSGLESTVKGGQGVSACLTQFPDCCRLVEAIFVRLSKIHSSPQKKNEKTLRHWPLIMQDYKKIRGLLLRNCAVMQGTSLQLIEVNQNTLIQWHNNCIKDQGLTKLLQEDLSQTLPETEDTLLTQTVSMEPTQHQALAHEYSPLQSTIAQAKLKRKAIGEPASIRPKLSTQRGLFESAKESAQYSQVMPHFPISAAPVLQAVRVLQPVPTFFCAQPQNTIPHCATQDLQQPRQKRSYTRVVKGNTCKKCGKFRSAVTGHSQYKGIVYCPQTETLDKKQWLEKMRTKWLVGL